MMHVRTIFHVIVSPRTVPLGTRRYCMYKVHRLRGFSQYVTQMHSNRCFIKTELTNPFLSIAVELLSYLSQVSGIWSLKYLVQACSDHTPTKFESRKGRIRPQELRNIVREKRDKLSAKRQVFIIL
jgi:hypothetical protein